MEISTLQNKIYFIKYYIKLIKYVQNVSFIFIFLNFRLNDWSIGKVIPWHSLQVEAQFKPAFLQEQPFPHGPLQPQRITLNRSGGPASMSIPPHPPPHPPPEQVFFCITQLFPNLYLMISSKPMMKNSLRRWWKKGWINV